ncbi:hypothetical protein Tco_1128076 [Tanacetum coccineum]
MARRPPHWKVIEHVNHKKFSNGGVIVVEEDPDVIHFDNSSDLLLSTSLNDLNNATLHIDGQSTEVDAPPDIIDLDEDDDIIDDEDALPHDKQISDDEVARQCKGTRKANLGGRKAGRLHTRQETRNLELKKITDDKGPGDAFVLPILAEGPDGAEGSDRDPKFEVELIVMTSWATSIKKSVRFRAIQRSAKLYQYQQGFSQCSELGINPEPGLMMWRRSDRDVPRALPRQIGMPKLHLESDPRNQARAAQNRKPTEEHGRLPAGFPITCSAFENEMRAPMATLQRQLFTYTVFGHETCGKRRHDDMLHALMLTQYESTPEFGSGSGGCGDDEIADDEDGGEDEEDGDS